MNKSKLINTIFYNLKPIIPRRFQIWLRRKMILKKRAKCSNVWPILEKAGDPPKGWSGWPDQKRFALVLTHDVELAGGREKCLELMNLEKGLGFRSSFNFVPKRYEASKELLDQLTKSGFEIGIQ